MTGSAYQAMDVLGTCDSLYRVGVWGRDYTKIFYYGRLADDGKRIQCDGRFTFVRKPSYRVGVWGRENAKIFSDGRLADDGKRLPSDGRFGLRAIAFIG